MPRIAVETFLAATPEAVWADLSRLDTHVEWMADAARLEFISERREGTGTRIRVMTRVGPLRTTDVMVFTAWEPPRLMAVTHQGRFTGEGRFRLDPAPGGTWLRWEETIRFPWYLGGAAGAWMARPVLTALWRRNLRRLAERFA